MYYATGKTGGYGDHTHHNSCCYRSTDRNKHPCADNSPDRSINDCRSHGGYYQRYNSSNT